jgi:hypothetical protein
MSDLFHESISDRYILVITEVMYESPVTFIKFAPRALRARESFWAPLGQSTRTAGIFGGESVLRTNKMDFQD